MRLVGRGEQAEWPGLQAFGRGGGYSTKGDRVTAAIVSLENGPKARRGTDPENLDGRRSRLRAGKGSTKSCVVAHSPRVALKALDDSVRLCGSSEQVQRGRRVRRRTGRGIQEYKRGRCRPSSGPIVQGFKRGINNTWWWRDAV